MRSSIAAQSCASVPPAPAWISRKQGLGSSGLLNMRRNSSRRRPLPAGATSASTAEQGVLVVVFLARHREQFAASLIAVSDG
jgi:hypothetical protein